MRKDDKASVSLKKVISISIILLFLMGIGVMAASSKLNNVKIILSDGYEMDVLTSKTNISEILDENHIMLLPTEKVIPSLDEDISDNNTIRIVLSSENIGSTEVISEELTMEKILENYESVTEKIVKEQVKIAYEIETKDYSSGSGEKVEKIVKNGVDGIKEITYKVKYLNGEETERIQISEETVKNPVNCVKEIKDKPVPVVTSRSSTVVPTSSGAGSSSLASRAQGMNQRVITFNTSAYCAASCGGNTKTATGATARSYYTVATDPRYYPMGTIFYIPYFANCPNGGWFVAQDTGGAIKGNKLDVYMDSYSQCTTFGRRNLECYVYTP